MLQLGENEIPLHKWCGGAKHLRSLEGTLILTHVRQSWVMIKRVLPQIQAAEIWGFAKGSWCDTSRQNPQP